MTHTRKSPKKPGLFRPGAKDVVELLRTYSSARDDDIDTFMGALIFNWLIAGTDAHAKNYSLLLACGGEAHLVPLYDVTSALPYKNLNQDKLSLAMKLGNHYRLRDISFHDREKLAKPVRMDSDRLFGRINAMIDELPGKAIEVLSGARQSQLVKS
ncbi:MAG: HipA domain-containing protein [Steroidobacteraceae bacterium]